MFNSLKSLLNKVLNTSLDSGVGVHRASESQDFNAFSDFTIKFIEFVKSNYNILEDNNSGFYSKTEIDNDNCFVRKFQLKEGENLWFMMLYDESTLDLTELHLFSSNKILTNVYDKDYISSIKDKFNLKNELDTFLPSRDINSKSSPLKI